MRIPDICMVASLLLAGSALTGCGNDPNKPATVDEQRAAMHHAPPSADQLKDAMSKVHFKTPGSDSVQKPPGGAMTPSSGKTGQ